MERLQGLIRNRDAYITLGLFILALIPRLVRLDQVPPGLSGDELFNAIDALRLGPSHWQIYFEGNNGREAIFLYLMAVSLKLLGQSIWAIRLPAALLGSATIPLAFLIGRHAFNRRVGLIGATVMAVSLWPLMLSRWGLRAVSLNFFTALTVYLYQKALGHQKYGVFWVAAGISLGLTLYTYIPARVFPLVILGWFVWLAAAHRTTYRKHLGGLILSLVVAVIVFTPFGLYIAQNPEKVNQRIESVGGANALEKALDGETAALLETISSVPLMFIAKGDTAERYHVQARPVFDPLSGFFFFLGAAATLWLAFRAGERNRRAAYGLLLLWAAAMLAPNALLGADSSFLRGAGAIVPVYLVAAIGVDGVFVTLDQRWPGRERLWRASLVILVSTGVILTLVSTWRAYFLVWPSSKVVREVYHADLAAIGRYLDRNPPPAGTQVYIGYNYVAETTPQEFAYYSGQNVTWFSHENTFSWSPGSGDSWTFEAAGKPLAPLTLARLRAAAEGEMFTFENGGLAFTLYKARADDLAWEPAKSTSRRFVDGPELVGFDAPGTLYGGETVDITLHWQIPAGLGSLPNRLTYATTHLEDESGNVWAKTEGLLGYPEAGWQPGDRFVQFMILEAPQGMPPGPVYLRFGLRDWQGPEYGVLPGSDERAGPFLIRGRPVNEITIESGTPLFDGVLALQGSTFSSLIMPGLPMDISLDWLVLKKPPADYRIQLGLYRPGDNEPFLTQTFQIWPDIYPPTSWAVGEQVTTLHRFNVPLDIPTDDNPELRIRLLLPDEDTPVPLSQGDNLLAGLTLVLRQHLFEPPTIGQKLEAQFGETIRLLGYDLDSADARPGGKLGLILYWQAITTPTDGYTVFNHLTGADGQIQGQFDSPPSGDAWLTSTWLPGEVIVDLREVPLRPGAAPGNYLLVIGLYTAADGQRLPVTVNSFAQPNDQLVVTQVLVEP